MHTAQHIVENCFRGELAQGRTLILVTHHISICLTSAAYIVELTAGKVELQGSIKDLQASGQLKTVIEAEDDCNEVLEEEEKSPVVENVNEADTMTGKRPPKTPAGDGRLMMEERREEGRVSLRTYLTYRTSHRFLEPE